MAERRSCFSIVCAFFGLALRRRTRMHDARFRYSQAKRGALKLFLFNIHLFYALFAGLGARTHPPTLVLYQKRFGQSACFC